MHGLVFDTFGRYLTESCDADTWPTLLERTGLADRVYLPDRRYPDTELLALVGTACTVTGRDPDVLLEQLGRRLAPVLLAVRKIPPHWRTVDVLEHSASRRPDHLRTGPARPPGFSVSRLARDRALLRYTSGRRLCALARGFAIGVAEALQERVEVAETACMLAGAGACVFEVAVLSAPAPLASPVPA